MKIYIDENLPPQLAEGLDILENPNDEGIRVFSIKKIFGEGVQDEEWIPKVGKEKGIVITQDYNIQRIRHQKKLYMEHGIGIFFFRSPSKKGLRYWEMVEMIVKRWAEMKKLARKNKPPFAYRCTSRKGFEPLDD